MILPLLPFFMTMDPAIAPTESAPIVMAFGRGTERERKFEICADRIKSTEIHFDGNHGRMSLSVVFVEDAQKELGELTARSVGRQVPIIFEGEVVTSPIVQEPILGGAIMITGIDTVAELERLERAARGRCTGK